MTIYRHLLLDWLTLRIPLDDRLSRSIHDRVLSCLGRIQCYASDGSLLWEKNALDVDKLRSDTQGLVWQVQSDGRQLMLVIAGSPASLENGGLNVFGSLDIRAAGETLLRVARRALRAILPSLEHWQCRRIDITGNYVLPDPESVKQALRMLMVTDGSRRKASSAKKGGDTVSWNPTSDLSKGKAYHKGPQLAYLAKQGKVKVSDSQLAAADRILRLEHTKAAKWWRRFEEKGGQWYRLTAFELWSEYRNFFGRLVQGVEVTEMNRTVMVTKLMECNAISEGRAEAAFTTLRNIREDGFEVVKGYMSHATFYRHLKYLRAAGVTDSDMTTAKILPFRPIKIVLAQPVGSWAECIKAA
ncbi:hypothetical protein GO613_02390 [Azoarcus communis]|uniref:phage/plasmid replication protein, II/X family n=1 Tax=Parazoarcus communis TaxID=41977 RepID=UPI0014592393|nr:phage/plasmid replication protein, II/X family [Parazoarcus communis]NMG46952.1 hypothetical protein [Parazoarcus communis]